MPFYIQKLDLKTGPYGQDYAALLADYAYVINAIMQDVAIGANDATDAIKPGKKLNHYFPEQSYDLFSYPHLWSTSNRIGASTIAIKAQAKNIQDSAYDITKLTLESLIKANKSNPERKAALNAHLNTLEILKKKSKEMFLLHLAKTSAQKTYDSLCAVEQQLPEKFLAQDIALIAKLKQGLLTITQIEKETFKNTADCFDYTNQVNQIKKQVQGLAQKIDKHLVAEIKHTDDAQYKNQLETNIRKIEELKQLAEQTSVITKRYIDPLYTKLLVKPKKTTTTQNIRNKVKKYSYIIAGVAGLAAGALFFVPGAQLIAAAVAMVACVSYVAYLDEGFELARHFWYGRTPTIKQAAPVIALAIISVPVAALYQFVAPISALIAGLDWVKSNDWLIDSIQNGFSKFASSIASLVSAGLEHQDAQQSKQREQDTLATMHVNDIELKPLNEEKKPDSLITKVNESMARRKIKSANSWRNKLSWNRIKQKLSLNFIKEKFNKLHLKRAGTNDSEVRFKPNLSKLKFKPSLAKVKPACRKIQSVFKMFGRRASHVNQTKFPNIELVKLKVD